MRSEIETLTRRIARLERTNRWLKLIGLGVVLISMALVSMGLGRKPRTIEAEKIVILDSHGRARLTIGTPEVAGAAVAMKPDAPAIWLSDESGSDRVILASDGLYFANSHENPLVDLSSGPSQPELRFYGTDGKVSWSAP
jgi:hypothetical protein